MPAYLIVEIEVLDRETYQKYVDQIPPVAARYGGRYLVRGEEVVPLSGDWHPERLILLEFESFEAITRFTLSPEYRALAPLRERSTRTRAVAAKGYRSDSP